MELPKVLKTSAVKKYILLWFQNVNHYMVINTKVNAIKQLMLNNLYVSYHILRLNFLFNIMYASLLVRNFLGSGSAQKKKKKSSSATLFKLSTLLKT